MTLTRQEIDNRFTYHVPTDTQTVHYTLIREFAKEFANRINSLCPDSREKSLAFTKLDELVMWANASIARNK